MFFNQVLSETEQITIMENSRDALRKIQIEKDSKKTKIESITEAYSKVSMGSELFEAYDMLFWEGKVKVDMLYFDQLLQKLEESDDIYKALGTYFKNIREIYEFVNLKPEIYGKSKGIDFAILEESNEMRKQKLSKVIFEYLDNSFYSLSPEQRQDRYLESSKELSKTLISEGVNPDEAIAFSTKVSIIENLLTKVAFPFSVGSRINFLMESEDYRVVFDQAALVDLMDSFRTKVHLLSKVVAAVI